MVGGQAGISRRALLRGAALTATGAMLGARRAVAAPPDGLPAEPFQLWSPNHRVQVKLVHSPQGLTWSVEHDGVAVVLPSVLGLRLASGVAIARRRGDTWFLGAMTNEQARTIELPLDFMGPGGWTAHVHADGAPQRCRATPRS